MGDGTFLNRRAILDLLATDQRYRETVADYLLAHRTCATPAPAPVDIEADEIEVAALDLDMSRRHDERVLRAGYRKAPVPVECRPCADSHPKHGCADVGCSHNCQGWTEQQHPAPVDDREALVGVLVKHHQDFSRFGSIGCGCGEWSGTTDEAYREHLTDVILAAGYVKGGR